MVNDSDMALVHGSEISEPDDHWYSAVEIVDGGLWDNSYTDPCDVGL